MTNENLKFYYFTALIKNLKEENLISEVDYLEIIEDYYSNNKFRFLDKDNIRKVVFEAFNLNKQKIWSEALET